MKGKAIMSDVELSYQELKALETHFKEIQAEALLEILKKPVETVEKMHQKSENQRLLNKASA